MNIADRAKQAGTATSDTVYALSGAASTGFLTFFSAFQMPTNAQKAGDVVWNDVPILVEVYSGTTLTGWQIITAQVKRNSSDVVSVENGTFRNSSTGSALGLTGSAAVTLSVVPSYWSQQQVEFGVRTPASAADKHTSKPGGCADGGLMTMGPQSFSDKAYATSIGCSAYPRLAYEQAFGLGLWGDVGDGEAISSRNVMMLVTTNATPTDLTSIDKDGDITTGAIDTIPMWPGLCVITGIVTAYEAATDDRKAWEVKYVIGGDADYSTVAILGTPTKTELYEAAGATAWDFVPTVTGTNLSFRVTGEAAHTISWVFTFNAHYHVEYP